MAGITFQKATKRRARARIAIDGPSGSGKTFTALIAATALANGGKIAVIDTEHGSASLYADRFAFDVLELDTFSPKLYVEAINAAEKAGYSVIVIDSLSHAWEGEGGALDMLDTFAAKSGGGNNFAAWKDVTPIHRRMVDAMLQSPAHIVATMRSKMDYVQEKDERSGKTVIKKVGMNPVQRNGMEYEFTLVADMDINHKITVSKTRCELMDDKSEHKPGASFWQPFVDWLNSGAPASETKPEPTPTPAPSPTPPPAPHTNGDPLAPDALLASIRKVEAMYAEQYGDSPIDTESMKRVAGALGKLVGDANRPVLLKRIANVESTKELRRCTGAAILKWLGIEKSGYVATRPQAQAEADALLADRPDGWEQEAAE